jgi:hypothetical protein
MRSVYLRSLANKMMAAERLPAQVSCANGTHAAWAQPGSFCFSHGVARPPPWFEAPRGIRVWSRVIDWVRVGAELGNTADTSFAPAPHDTRERAGTADQRVGLQIQTGS